MRRNPGSIIMLLSFLALVPWTTADAGWGSGGWGHAVTIGPGVVHVWSEFPPPMGGPVIAGYPAWGYRFHPSYAMVDCDLDPEEAAVLLDGELLGEADDFDGFPSYLFVRPGHHHLEFRAPGLESLVLRGDFRSGAFIRIDREMEPGVETHLVDLGDPDSVSPPPLPESQQAPPQLPADDGPAGALDGPPPAPEPPQTAGDAGFLRLLVKPADAAVYIDDRFFGSGEEISRLHGYIRLTPGEHTIQAIRPGYRSRVLPVNILVDDKQHLDLWLEAEPDPGED